jgi:thiamine biosynthesis lipoprotein
MKRCRPQLGTFVEIEVDEIGGLDALAAIEQGFAAVARVAARMSFHDPASDLSRINAAAAGSSLRLDPWTVELLALAQALHTATGGSFDCGVGVHLKRWGLLPTHADARPNDEAEGGSIADLEILDAGRVRLRRAVCLDLGGIAKGYAVDQAIAALERAGVTSAIVNAGGDLRVLGERARPIHLRRPDAPDRLVHAGDLADGALATSAPYFSLVERDGRPHSALADPRSGAPITRPASCSVLAPSCAVADGLAKALAVDGRIDPDCLARYEATAWVL